MQGGNSSARVPLLFVRLCLIDTARKARTYLSRVRMHPGTHNRAAKVGSIHHSEVFNYDARLDFPASSHFIQPLTLLRVGCVLQITRLISQRFVCMQCGER